MKYNLSAIKRTKDEDLKQEMFKRFFLKRMNKQKVKKPVKSLQDECRWYQKENDFEAWTEYGFFEAEGMSDEEIQECVDDMRIVICSPYDCTGKELTLWIDWHRNPCGLISVIHRKAIDV